MEIKNDSVFSNLGNYSMKQCIVMIALIALNIQSIHSNEIPTDHTKRHSSYPYISGDTFRAVCHHHIDETRTPFDPHAVAQGDIIFVRGYPEFLDAFLTQLPAISNKFILITHNMDESMPGKYAYLLDDARLCAWFTQNKGPINHPKLFPLPIGLANAYWGHGNIQTLTSALSKAQHRSKRHLLYVNFDANTNGNARNHVLRYFSQQPFSYVSGRKPWKDYLDDLASSKFILSPPGNGIDCHRAWEALYMGSIPVMKSTSIDSLFDDLPVVIVRDWPEVTKKFLEQKYEEIKGKTYNLNKLYADFWLEQIQQIHLKIK